MVDPLISQIGKKIATEGTKPSVPAAEKIQASKFDQVRNAQGASPVETTGQLPPELQQLPEEAMPGLQADLRRRLEQTQAKNAADLFRGDHRANQSAIDSLSRRIREVPQSPLADGLKQRLVSIESQYVEAGRLLDATTSLDSPRELMKVQVHMYRLAQNIELVSKVVEQVTGGIRTILQTQL